MKCFPCHLSCLFNFRYTCRYTFKTLQGSHLECAPEHEIEAIFSQSGPKSRSMPAGFVHKPASVPLIEKEVVFDQLYEYLTMHDLLADTQSGFTPGHSTQTALLEATND